MESAGRSPFSNLPLALFVQNQLQWQLQLRLQSQNDDWIC